MKAVNCLCLNEVVNSVSIMGIRSREVRFQRIESHGLKSLDIGLKFVVNIGFDASGVERQTAVKEV